MQLHLESQSGVPHLHGAFCRIDEQGHINNDHDIHLRAQRAAERVALKRGWTTAAEVRETNIGQVNRDCMETLRSMENWSWDEYAAIFRSKGYEIWELHDNRKILRGYVLKKGNARYKASELGRGRNLMASKLESTWEKLHATPKTKTVSTPPVIKKPIPTAARRCRLCRHHPRKQGHGKVCQLFMIRHLPVVELVVEHLHDLFGNEKAAAPTVRVNNI